MKSDRLNVSSLFGLKKTNIIVSDLIDSPGIVRDANNRFNTFRTSIYREEAVIEGITLEDMQVVSMEQLYLFNNYTPLLNYYSSITSQNVGTVAAVPSKIYGCRVKIDDIIPDANLFSDEKKRLSVLACNPFCFIDETELSEYTTLKKDTLVKVQFMDEARQVGKIVQAVNYISGLITITAGGTSDNFSQGISLLGAGPGIAPTNYRNVPSNGLLYPLGDVVSTFYGAAGEARKSTLETQSHIHAGIDLAASEGTPIYSAYAGKVVQVNISSDNKGSGNAVWIEHTGPQGKFYTAYMHMRDKPLVEKGNPVQIGQSIGLLGNTGHSSGPHLHFEVRTGGYGRSSKIENPLSWITDISKIKLPSGQDARLNEERQALLSEQQRRGGNLQNLPEK